MTPEDKANVKLVVSAIVIFLAGFLVGVVLSG